MRAETVRDVLATHSQFELSSNAEHRLPVHFSFTTITMSSCPKWRRSTRKQSKYFSVQWRLAYSSHTILYCARRETILIINCALNTVTFSAKHFLMPLFASNVCMYATVWSASFAKRCAYGQQQQACVEDRSQYNCPHSCIHNSRRVLLMCESRSRNYECGYVHTRLKKGNIMLCRGCACPGQMSVQKVRLPTNVDHIEPTTVRDAIVFNAGGKDHQLRIILKARPVK